MKKLTKTNKAKLKEILKLLISENDTQGIKLFFEKEDDFERSSFFSDLFIKTFFSEFFFFEDADFHQVIDLSISELVALDDFKKRHLNIIGFMESAKTSRTKLNIVKSIVTKKLSFIKIISANKGNADEFVTDLYNLLNSEFLSSVYPGIFEKKQNEKEPQRLNHFVATVDERKITVEAKTPLVQQRGQVKNSNRPDLVVFDDIETYATLFSQATTEKIFYGLKEARGGLDTAVGKSILLGNYLSDSGNVQAYLDLPDAQNIIIPLVDEKGKPTWSDKYVLTDKEAEKENKKRSGKNKVTSVESIKRDPMKKWEEYQCQPVSPDDLFFSFEQIEKMLESAVDVKSDFKIFSEPKEKYSYSLGADVSEGVGRDYSTTSILEIQDDQYVQVASYENNRIDPFDFADEIISQAETFNKSFLTPENNSIGYATVGQIAKSYSEDKIFKHYNEDQKDGEENKSKKLGWRATKPNIIKAYFEFKKDFDEGRIIVKDINVLKEMKHFKQQNLSDVGEKKKQDERIAGSHFDRLRALVLAHTGIKQATEEKYFGVLFA